MSPFALLFGSGQRSEFVFSEDEEQTQEEPQAERVEEVVQDASVGSEGSFEEVMSEMAAAAVRQAQLVAKAKASHSRVLEEKVTSLQAQLSVAQAELASSKAEQKCAEELAQRLAKEKLDLMTELDRTRADDERRDAEGKWAMKFLERNKEQHLANLTEFCNKVTFEVNSLEEHLRKMTIEFDEELYPHLAQSVAERR